MSEDSQNPPQEPKTAGTFEPLKNSNWGGVIVGLIGIAIATVGTCYNKLNAEKAIHLSGAANDLSKRANALAEQANELSAKANTISEAANTASINAIKSAKEANDRLTGAVAPVISVRLVNEEQVELKDGEGLREATFAFTIQNLSSVAIDMSRTQVYTALVMVNDAPRIGPQATNDPSFHVQSDYPFPEPVREGGMVKVDIRKEILGQLMKLPVEDLTAADTNVDVTFNILCAARFLGATMPSSPGPLEKGTFKPGAFDAKKDISIRVKWRPAVLRKHMINDHLKQCDVTPWVSNP